MGKGKTMRKSVVTGGAGFIGSHMVERLLADGDTVVAIDNLVGSTGANLTAVAGHPRFRFEKMDINEADRLRPLIADADRVFHFAALADIVPSIQRPVEYHRANVDGTITVLEAAREAGTRRFIYAASSSCYGIPDVYPTPEDTPICPMYPYALTKYLGEQYVLHWHKFYGLPVVSLRLFNVYGPRVRTTGTYGAVFGVFLAQKLAGQALTIVGDGTQTRDFTFVSDVIEAFLKASEADVVGEIMNVGSGHTYSVNRLVELLGGPSVHIPKRPGEPDCTFAETAKIRRRLAWQPKVSFEEGVAIMLENIDSWREAPVWTAESIKDATREWFTFLGRDAGS
jgi:UDP-glucose 4-epimerase